MKINKSLRQLSFYSFFGILSLSIDFILYILLSEILLLSSSISKVLSFIAASLNSFILNKTFTFKVRKFYIKQPIRFFILYSISLFFNSLVHDLFKQSFDGLIPFGIATFVSVIINFFGQKLWVFRKS